MPVQPGSRRNVALAVVLCVAALAGSACRRSTLPDALSDRDFWGLIESLSEPAGVVHPLGQFRLERAALRRTVRRLRAEPAASTSASDPEQNFSYIATLAAGDRLHHRHPPREPALCTCCTRRSSSSRPIAPTSSRGCSRDRVPPDSDVDAGVDEIFDAVERASPSSPDLHAETSALVRERLLTTRGLPLAAGRSRLDRPRVQGVLRRRAGDRLLRSARAWTPIRPIVPAADDDEGFGRAAAAAFSRPRIGSRS